MHLVNQYLRCANEAKAMSMYLTDDFLKKPVAGNSQWLSESGPGPPEFHRQRNTFRTVFGFASFGINSPILPFVVARYCSVPYVYSYPAAIMAHDAEVIDWLERAKEADEWAASVPDASLKAQWVEIAKGYRALARERLETLLNPEIPDQSLT